MASQSVKDKYLEMDRALLAKRATGTLTEDEEDDILEELDELWWSMTDQERTEVQQEISV